MSQLAPRLSEGAEPAKMTPAMQRLFSSLAVLFLATACATTSPVSISSEPPGAAIYVDGKHSGFTTPAVISLAKKQNHTVVIALSGYEREERAIVDDPDYETLLWREMAVLPKTWRFPLWLNLEDFFVPVKKKYLLKPSRIFVRLDRTADR